MKYFVASPDPKVVDKERWLIDSGRVVRPLDHLKNDEMLVCLITYITYSTAAVVDSQETYDECMDPDDTRLKWWFAVSHATLVANKAIPEELPLWTPPGTVRYRTDRHEKGGAS